MPVNVYGPRRGDGSVLAWTQPVLPPLPPGEAQSVQPFEMVGGTAQHPPQTAPGFQSAWRLGMLPAPAPLVAPQRLPGLSAHDMLVGGIVGFFGSIVLLSTVGDLLPGFLFAVLAIVGCGGSFWQFFRLHAREEQEFALGYTSRSAYTGLWRLGRDGSVLREPDRSVPPPGFYPSPYQPGLLQKWDGPGWRPFSQKWRQHPHNWFRWPERPYLDGVPNHPVSKG
jgi:hypothetical protein